MAGECLNPPWMLDVLLNEQNGYSYSQGAAYQYDGSHLVDIANGGVISVVIQYRLGLFGENAA